MREMNQSRYAVKIQMAEFPEKFQMSRLKQYAGTVDLVEYMCHSCNQMDLYTGKNVLMC